MFDCQRAIQTTQQYNRTAGTAPQQSIATARLRWARTRRATRPDCTGSECSDEVHAKKTSSKKICLSIVLAYVTDAASFL